MSRRRRAGLNGLVSLKGGLRRVVIRQLSMLGFVGFPIPEYDALAGTGQRQGLCLCQAIVVGRTFVFLERIEVL